MTADIWGHADDHAPWPGKRAEIAHDDTIALPKRGPRGATCLIPPRPHPTGDCPVCKAKGVPVMDRWGDRPGNAYDHGPMRALVESYRPCADTAACVARMLAPKPKALPAGRPSQARKTLLGGAP